MFFFSAGYVAGFVDPEVSNRSDLFDVYVNLPDSVITVSQSAKGAVFTVLMVCVLQNRIHTGINSSQSDQPPHSLNMHDGEEHRDSHSGSCLILFSKYL